MHRDIKPENLLLRSRAPDSALVLVDFGIAEPYLQGQPSQPSFLTMMPSLMMCPEGDTFSTVCGSPTYVAPEVLAHNYDHRADLWSTGVILYILLCGETPFYGDDPNAILKHVKSGRYMMDQEAWTEVSPSAQNLVEQLLCFDPARRLSATEALRHPWILNEGEGREVPLYAAASAMRAFNSHRKMKKAILGLMSRVLELDELEDLRAVFIEADIDRDGWLDVDEVKDVIRGAGYDMGGNQLSMLLQEVDVGRDGKINLNEFLAAGMQRSLYLKEANLMKTFEWLDKDKTGLISKEVLRVALNIEEESEVDAMMKETDTNGDGMIDYDEFVSVMSDRHLQKSFTHSRLDLRQSFLF